MGVIILGVFAMGLGVLGCFTFKCKKAIFAIPFVILNFLIGLIIFILGIAMLTPVASNVAYDRLCGPKSTMDKSYNSAVSNFMCTDWCPCPDDDATKKLW